MTNEGGPQDFSHLFEAVTSAAYAKIAWLIILAALGISGQIIFETLPAVE